MDCVCRQNGGKSRKDGTMFMRWIGVTAVFAMLCVSLSAQTPDVGQTAPDFTLSTPDGHAKSLNEYTKHGTVGLVVLRGFPGYQCPYCVKQVHDFIENAGEFKALGAEVMLVYPGPPADLDAHAKDFLVKQNPLPANVQLVIDPDYRFTTSTGSVGMRRTRPRMRRRS